VTPGQVLRHTFPTLDLTTVRLYRARVAGQRRWRNIAALDDAEAIAEAQTEGAIVALHDITRTTGGR
jgi:hypothetical protein